MPWSRSTGPVALDMADYNGANGSVRVRGKGNWERLAFTPTGAKTAVAEWASVRGTEPGAFLTRTDRDAAALAHPSGTAIAQRMRRQAAQAGTHGFSLHDLRRTFLEGRQASGGEGPHERGRMRT